MARVQAVYQDSVFQDTSFQDNTWGLSAFQHNVFQGDAFDVHYLLKIISENLGISSVRLTAKAIIQLITESIRVGVSALRAFQLNVFQRNAFQIPEEVRVVTGLIKKINESIDITCLLYTSPSPRD